MSNEIIYPRSPRETMDGWYHLPRFIDKVRLHLAGKLPADYQENFLNRGFDAAWLKAAGLSGEQFVEVVKKSITDGEVCDWVRKNVKKSATEKKQFNDSLLSYGREGEMVARLKMRKEQSGLTHRDDIQCFFDYIDADEKRG
jgi:hypothetical protein